MSGRTLVIGIDGGELSLIKKWIAQGKLPVMKRIMEQGSHGNLESTIPPITGAAWSSFQTGTNPGKHGAFNWFKRLEGEYRAAPVTAHDISEPTIWEIMGKLDQQVGVLGVPVTYPPHKVNGFLIPGLLTPPTSRRQSYPAHLIEEIREIAPDFKFAPKEWTRGYAARDWVDELKQDVDNRLKVTEHLLETRPWNLFMVHFMETDQVQHFMWDYHQDDDDWDPLYEVYQRVDRAIGRIQEKLDDEDTLLIMSDHGFGPLNFNFHIDTWLLKEGYMKFRKNTGTRLKQIAFKLGITKETLYPIGELIYPLLRKTGLLKTAIELASHPWLEWLFLSSQNVDWPRTMAYTHSEIGHIYLNVKGREPQGCLEPEEVPRVREELMGRLKELKNPYNGKKITGKIYTGEEIYHGDKADQAPDIVFLPDDMEILGKGAYEFLSHKIVSRSHSQNGHHRMQGLFMATGPGVKAKQEIEGAHIMDIIPTILFNMDLPLFNHMDGQVIDSIFKEEFLEEMDRDYIDKSDIGLGHNDSDPDPDDGGEDDEMTSRLKGLGYVS